MKGIIKEIFLTILLALLIFMGIRSVAHNFEVNGHSMDPTLHNGEFVIVSKAAYWFGDPQRGDIVVFDTPRLNHDIIHRIVGMPGEKIEIRNGRVFINGKLLVEPYISLSPKGRYISEGLTEIPENCYFIVGDNRSASSTDVVPRDDIIGKAWLIYWPFDSWKFAPNYSWNSNEVSSGTSAATAHGLY